MLHELNQASLKVGHSMNLWRPRLCTTSSLRTKTYPLSLTATKSKKSIITSTSVIAFPWIPPQRNKKSNIVSPSDDKLSIIPTVTYIVELNLTNNKRWTQNYAESPRKNHALHQVESLLTVQQIQRYVQNPGRKFRAEKKVWDIMEKISKLTRNWDGHVARTTENRWPPTLRSGRPRRQKRNQGRPRTDGGTTWIVS